MALMHCGCSQHGAHLQRSDCSVALPGCHQDVLLYCRPHRSDRLPIRGELSLPLVQLSRGSLQFGHVEQV